MATRQEREDALKARESADFNYLLTLLRDLLSELQKSDLDNQLKKGSFDRLLILAASRHDIGCVLDTWLKLSTDDEIQRDMAERGLRAAQQSAEAALTSAREARSSRRIAVLSAIGTVLAALFAGLTWYGRLITPPICAEVERQVRRHSGAHTQPVRAHHRSAGS